jgi:cell shape-determining protein MreC
MVSLGFEKKIKSIVLKFIDSTLGKKYPAIDKLTDIFQEQENLAKDVRELKTQVEALEHFLVEKEK